MSHVEISLHDTVKAAVAAGFSVLPPLENGSKCPESFWLNSEGKPTWHPAQEQASSLEVVLKWYSNGRTAIGLVLGKVSGNAEALEFDCLLTYDAFKQAAALAGLGPLIERLETGYVEASPRGIHWIYRCDEISGNQKLAKADKTKVLIETRGEGGYLIISPSYGTVHPSGKAYRLIAGSLATIPILTPEERRSLFQLAATFDQVPTPKHAPLNTSGASNSSGDRPGDDFNRRESWSELLESAGWTYVYDRGDACYWRRPGKQSGVSACTGWGGKDYFYCWSTSTEFKSETPYDKFGFYTASHHQGDFSTSTRELGKLGYGKPFKPSNKQASESVDLPVWTPANDPADADIPSDLLTIPFGIGAELVNYILSLSTHPNPIFAVQTALSFAGLVLSRWHYSEYRNYTNLFALIIGETSSGKEDAKTAIETLISECNLNHFYCGKGYSHPSAIYTALQDSPKHITLIDEIGLYLKEQRNSQSPVNLVVREFMELFGRAHGLHHAPRLSMISLTGDDRKKIQEQRKPIVKPALSLLALSTPETFYGALNTEHLTSGFLNRFLIVESRAKRTLMQFNSDQAPVPDAIKDWVSQLLHTEILDQMNCACPYDINPMGKRWPFTTDARNQIRCFEQQMLDRADELDRQQPGLGTQALRNNEISMRLATIVAGLDFTGDYLINNEHLRWTQRYTECHLNRTLQSMHRYMHASEFEANRKLVLEAIRSASTMGVTGYEMGRQSPFTRWRGKELDELLASLQGGQLIDLRDVNKGKLGRSRMAWVALTVD